MLRGLLFVLALAAASLCAAPVVAQAPAPAERSVAARAAATQMVRLFYVDSGVIPYALDRVLADQLPAMRRDIFESDYMRRLPRRRREAVEAYFTNLSEVIQRELEPRMPAMLTSAEIITLKLFTDAEVVEMAAFFDTPQMRSFVTDLIRQGVDSELAGNRTNAPTLTSEQTAAFARFSQTPAGAAFEAKGGAWGQALGAAMATGLGDAGPALTQRVIADLCELLESDCPAELRSAPAPT